MNDLLNRIFNARAIFSGNRVYRYTLARKWNYPKRPIIAFVMLNPSTADERVLDPTVRRCVGYAKNWGYGAIVVLNIFAYRSTDPSELKKVNDPIGIKNDKFIKFVAIMATTVMVAWGVHGRYLNRGEIVSNYLKKRCKLYCLKITKDGFPSHPLYLKSDLIPQTFHMQGKENKEFPHPFAIKSALGSYRSHYGKMF